MANSFISTQKHLAELRENVFSLRVVKSGIVIFESTGKMLKPLLECLSNYKNDMEQAVVIDKVIGRAAAMLCVLGKVQQVITLVASKSAQTVLDKYGIGLYAEKSVATIMNHDKTGLCPMELLALSCDTPEEFFMKLVERQNFTIKNEHEP